MAFCRLKYVWKLTKAAKIAAMADIEKHSKGAVSRSRALFRFHKTGTGIAVVREAANTGAKEFWLFRSETYANILSLAGRAVEGGKKQSASSAFEAVSGRWDELTVSAKSRPVAVSGDVFTDARLGTLPFGKGKTVKRAALFFIEPPDSPRRKELPLLYFIGINGQSRLHYRFAKWVHNALSSIPAIPKMGFWETFKKNAVIFDYPPVPGFERNAKSHMVEAVAANKNGNDALLAAIDVILDAHAS